MTWARRETIQSLYDAISRIPVVDAHTHIQDDLTGFTPEMARANLAGTQASFNRLPQHVIDAGIKNKRLARRTMADATHAAFYSWFAEAAEGGRGNLDRAIWLLGDNSEAARRKAGRALIEELQPARFSEYAEWLRIMYRMYDLPEGIDPLDPAKFDLVYDTVKAKRDDPDFAAQVLRDANIVGYVTSIENRDKLPPADTIPRADSINLAYATHPEVYHMLDLHYLLWPGGATDLGYYFNGEKYESGKYIQRMEQVLGLKVTSSKVLGDEIEEFLWRTLHHLENIESRIRYANLFQPLNSRLSAGFNQAVVDTALRYGKGHLEGEELRQICAFVMQRVLVVLDLIGEELIDNGEEHGVCLQIAIGTDYFMDRSREIQSYPGYTARFAQEEYAVWTAYPHIHFEYIVAHEMLYRDLANAAKQTGNVSVGAWWHLFRKDHLARLIHDQLTMGPTTSIALGFTDARFVEMAAAKYCSLRWGLAGALAELVDDPASSLYKREDEAVKIAGEMLFDNPCKIHHLPFERKA